jgi:hypothetical protein
MKCVAVWSASLSLALLLAGRAAPQAPAAADVEFFEKKVRPVLVEHCFPCHSAGAPKVKAGLLLDSRANLLKGGDNGPAAVPGQPERSRLVEAIHYQNVDLRMPPRGKLPDTAIADLTAWVKQGAPWPGEKMTASAIPNAEFDLQKRKREHWAWQPIQKHVPSTVKNTAWPCAGVDAFVLAKLEEQGLAPAQPAERRTLIRRVYFDLVGLPPTPEQVQRAVADKSERWLEKLVDELLASPHFGERWGRHWLDLVRYAETRGHEYDFPLPNAYQYRDYVIRALNADVPYDRFVTEHVAGDLLATPRLHPVERFNESILGTGFWFLGEETHSPVDIRQDQADRFDNRIDTFGKTFLGLTVACARCHDHKFDAISARDYYALFGFLESCSPRLVRFDAQLPNRSLAADLATARNRLRPVVQRSLSELFRPGVNRAAEYLLAARESVLSPHVSCASFAEARKLDPAVLERWVTCLCAAAKDERDPLHAVAKLVGDADTKDAEQLAARVKLARDAFRKRASDSAKGLQGGAVIVDYRGALRPDQWLPDDVTFGLRPIRTGELRVAQKDGMPRLSFSEFAAAAKDAFWDGIKPAAGCETDAGALGGIPRAGRTIRTPAFTLTGNKLYYLVKGTFTVYAAVDQHLLVNGPLHGQLVHTVKAGDNWQWIWHDLTPYKGQRCHVEFIAHQGADFSLALVTQGDRDPVFVSPPNTLVQELFDENGKNAASIEAVAKGYQRLLQETLERLSADKVIGTPDAADRAGLANWLMRHADLFGIDPKRVVDAAAPLISKEAALAGRMKTESRLALAMLDGNGQDENVFIRGSPKAPGQLVPRRFLEALAGPEPMRAESGSGRLELARQMTDPALDPLLPRVLVNRVWHHLFGRGIVASVDNLGVLGERPTHPELLDYLADRFVREGWSIKQLIRELVLTRTYQMSAHPDAGDAADPQNLLLHRMHMKRLEGEAIRDAILCISGRLDRRPFGPSVSVYLTPFQDGRGRPDSGPLDGDGRRSVYLAVRRNFLSSFLLAFDTPIPFSTVGRRTVSNVPAQALILMNDPFVQQQAEVWAKRVLADSGPPEERIRTMYEAAFSRLPTQAESATCRAFFRWQADFGNNELNSWTNLAHVLFNAKQFIFVD